MPAERFLDTFQFNAPRTQAATSPNPPAIFSPGVGGGGNNRNSRLTREQVKNYTYWTYIAVSRICDKFSEPFPNVGIPTNQPVSGSFNLSKLERQFLRQHYGSRVIQSMQEDLEPVDQSHPLVQLLQRPNTEDSWSEFAFESCLFLKLTGTFYWWMVPGAGIPSELHVLPTQRVEREWSKSGQLKWYKVTPEGGGTQEKLPPEEVMCARMKSPLSKVEGWSSLHAGPIWLDNAENIEQSRWHAFSNGTNPDVYIKLGEAYGKPTPDDITAIKERFMLRTAGVRRTGEPTVVPPGVEIEPASRTPREMDYGNSSTQTRDNNLALHGVPPVVAGISSDYNRATAEAGFLVFCEVTMNPLFRFMAGVLTDVATRFDPRLRVWYPDCRPDNSEQRLREQEFAARNGAYSPDEIRMDVLGKEPFGEPAYESGYMPQGMVPLSEDAQPEPLPPVEPPPVDGEDEPEDDEEPTGDDADDTEEDEQSLWGGRINGHAVSS